MTMQIRLTGGKAFQKALQAASDRAQAYVADELEDIASELQGDIVLKIQQGAKTGRVYRRGGVVHQASAPGQSPASDTGALMGSIYSEQEGRFRWSVGSRLVYALYLEYGTVKMAARPYFRPAVEDMMKEFRSRLQAALARAVA